MHPLRLVAAALAALAQSALADSTLGLNFCDNWENPHVADAAADGFAGWVDSRAIGDTTNPAAQSTPLALGASGVSVTWTASNTWSAGSETTNEQALYRVYLDDGQTTTGVGVQVTITGLGTWLAATGNGSYRIRCYANNDSANTFQAVSVRNGSSATSPVLQTITPAALGNGDYPTAGSPGTGVSRGYGDSLATLTAGTITLTIPPRSGTVRGTLCAIKITAIPPAVPTAATLAATAVADTSATLNGTVNANSQSTAVTFQYGSTTAYGSTVAANPATVVGSTAAAVSAGLANLPTNATYHYRVAATSVAGTVYGSDQAFATTPSAALTGLTPDTGTLNPEFSKTVTSFLAQVPFATTSIRLTPVAEDAGATIRVQGAVVASGAASTPLNLVVGNTTITTAVTSAGGAFTRNYVLTVTRLPETYVFNSPSAVPVTAGDFNATDQAARFVLNHAPEVGAVLTVVNNTGLHPITGTFANLAQWQVVRLTYAGVTYPFVANYFGGTGNDLVLQWANTRVLAWGYNSSGQVGNNSTTACLIPVAVSNAGILAGRTAVGVVAGSTHSLALFADGAVAAWGSNYFNPLGNNSSLDSKVPVAVDGTGALLGKKVVLAAAGGGHNLALCADGTLVAWGKNLDGQLGLNSGQYSASTPVAVDRTGILAGRRVVAVAAGDQHSLALCADGTLAAWGSNLSGQLGITGITSSIAPLQVPMSGALAGKSVVAIAAGGSYLNGNAHSLALCADGSVVGWGNNASGQLGNNSTTGGPAPVLVDRSGVLAGKTVVAISAGGGHSLALCADGTVAAWGDNSTGELGDNSQINRLTPVLVDRTGVLAGTTVTAVSAGRNLSLATCASGDLVAWGGNYLGNNSTAASSVPVVVSRSSLLAGERFMAGVTQDMASHSLALVASPPPPLATTLAATAVTATGATLNASVSPNGSTTSAVIEYGLTTAYGSVITPAPASFSGTAGGTTAATLAGLRGETIYHYRVVATSTWGTANGDDMTFTTTGSTQLTALSLSAGTLAPSFRGDRTTYAAVIPPATTEVTVTPTATSPTAVIRVAGAVVTSGQPSAPLPLNTGDTSIPIVVTAADGVNSLTYTVTITRLPAAFTFGSAADVPVTSANFDPTGLTATFVLGFTPAPGTLLTVVGNTGSAPLGGEFANLADGQLVTLTFGGTDYRFVANYHGGDGNDLVLQWANTRLYTWGWNSHSELGDGSNPGVPAYSTLPVPVNMAGVLADKTPTRVATGLTHCFALCADATVAAWGTNSNGKLGIGAQTVAVVPALVDRSGVLAGKRVLALAGGEIHTIGLCADGTLAAWGSNTNNQLGNPAYNGIATVSTPVLVNTTGALAGKTVIAIAAAYNHSVALCADGMVAVWGSNSYGQYANGTTVSGSVPVLVSQSGVLTGRRVTAIATGTGHVLALCSDGALVAWGFNGGGQLGNGTTVASTVPVLVDRSGVLAGRTVTAIACGGTHCLALCADGALIGWGADANGQLGNGASVSSSVPVRVEPSGALSGRIVTGISAGGTHSAAVCADGTLLAWGANNLGQLGSGGTTASNVPAVVQTSALPPGARGMGVASCANSNLALLGFPLPAATTLAVTQVTAASATVNGRVNAAGNAATVSFEYGPTTAYGTSVAATPDSAAGLAATPVSANLTGLVAGATCHYRVVAACAGGISRGADATFIASAPPVFAGYAVSTAFQTPATIACRKLLVTASDPDGDAIFVTAAGAATANGGTAAWLGASILYTPAVGFSGTDSFPVTLTDAGGASVVGTVAVTVGAAPGAGGVGANPSVLTTLPDGKMGVSFHGIPGRSYIVQRSVDGLANWSTLATVVADAAGRVSFTDLSPPVDSAFYRLGLP